MLQGHFHLSDGGGGEADPSSGADSNCKQTPNPLPVLMTSRRQPDSFIALVLAVGVITIFGLTF
jgi:hypothetical protein